MTLDATQYQYGFPPLKPKYFYQVISRRFKDGDCLNLGGKIIEVISTESYGNLGHVITALVETKEW